MEFLKSGDFVVSNGDSFAKDIYGLMDLLVILPQSKKARAGIEPAIEVVADPCLTTWLNLQIHIFDVEMIFGTRLIFE